MFSVSLNLLCGIKKFAFTVVHSFAFPSAFLLCTLPSSEFLAMNQLSSAFFPHFFLGKFVETMKPRAPVSSRCRHELTLLPRGWGPENSELSHPLSSLISCCPMSCGHNRTHCLCLWKFNGTFQHLVPP